jgi:hypothetical protein
MHLQNINHRLDLYFKKKTELMTHIREKEEILLNISNNIIPPSADKLVEIISHNFHGSEKELFQHTINMITRLVNRTIKCKTREMELYNKMEELLIKMSDELS